jgi:hypothetical protein
MKKRKKVAKQKGRKRKDKWTLDAETVAEIMYTGKKTPPGGKMFQGGGGIRYLRPIDTPAVSSVRSHSREN